MKIQCGVCEAAEATILCCADEASLCWACDQKVHSANKLVSKHRRVQLSSSSTQMPKCDICQETVGYFFCLEDRSLLCRKCDISIHKANSLVSKHQRFLLTGVRVGLEATLPSPSSSSEKTVPAEKTTTVLEPHSVEKGATSVVSTAVQESTNRVQANDSQLSNLRHQLGSATDPTSPWQLDQYVGFGGISENYPFMYNASSEVHHGNKICSTVVEPIKGSECESPMPESFWAVPQVPSLHTVAEHYLPEAYHNPSETAFSVPDIRNPCLDSVNRQHQSSNSIKRRRQY